MATMFSCPFVSSSGIISIWPLNVCRIEVMSDKTSKRLRFHGVMGLKTPLSPHLHP
jgi:hypothetical protein